MPRSQPIGRSSISGIGHGYQGRTIWAAKISDNVAVNDNEPEVLFDGLTPSDEHRACCLRHAVKRRGWGN